MYGALMLRISRTSERADATEPKKKNTEQRHLSDVEEFADRLDLRTAQGLVKLARSAKPEDADYLAETAMTRGIRHVRIAVDVVQAQRMQQLTRYALLTSIFAAIAAIMSAVAAFLALID